MYMYILTAGTILAFIDYIRQRVPNEGRTINNSNKIIIH